MGDIRASPRLTAFDPSSWFEGKDPDDQLLDELEDSILEERPEREVIVREQFHKLDDEHELGLRFLKNNHRIDATWISHVRLLYRDENHEPAHLDDLWTPASVIPLDVLSDRHPGSVVDWLVAQGQEFEPWRASESVFVRPPPMDEDRVLLELDQEVPVLRCCSHYLTRDGELLLVHGSLLTTDHLLFYERHLPWERDLATPWEQGKEDP